MWKKVVVNRKINNYVDFGYMPKKQSQQPCIFVQNNSNFYNNNQTIKTII